MNKRQKKKFSSKLYQKKYINFRNRRILQIISEYYADNIDDEFNIVLITDSKKSNMKHIKKVNVLNNVQPIAINRKEPIDYPMEFICNPLDNKNIKEDDIILKYYNVWIKRLKEEI